MRPEDMTILTVDDTPANIRLLTHYLEKQGYKVITAEDGFEGFKAAVQYHPDLVLLDIMMPGTDGYEVCELLKAEEETKDIPIVFLTAKTDVEDRLRGFELGARDYITKPFNLMEISTRVETQLKLKYFEKQNEHFRNALKHTQAMANLGTLGKNIAGDLQSIIDILQKQLHKIQDGIEHKTVLTRSLMKSLETIGTMIALVDKWNELSELSKQGLKNVEVASLVNDAVELARHWSNKPVDIMFEKPESGFNVSGNLGQLYQVLSTILLGVMELTEKGDTIRVSTIITDISGFQKNWKEGELSDSAVKIDIISKNSGNLNGKLNKESELLIKISENEVIDLSFSAASAIIENHGGSLNLIQHKDTGINISLILPCCKL